MALIKPMVSSKTFEWPTPQRVFDLLNDEFHFTLDVCATKKNAKCKKFYTKKENGLIQDWGNNICFMNPPFQKQTKLWLQKAYEESLKGTCVVALIQVGTGRLYWHDLIFPCAAQIRFVRGFLTYGKAKMTAPFSSAVVVFDKKRSYIQKITWDFSNGSIKLKNKCKCAANAHECCDICTGYAKAKSNGTLRDKKSNGNYKRRHPKVAKRNASI